MALPIILIGAAAVAGAYGVKKGYDGFKDQSEANALDKLSKDGYDQARASHDNASDEAGLALGRLREPQLQIGSEFQDFSMIAKELSSRLGDSGGEDLTINIPLHQLRKIEEFSSSATEYLGAVIGGSGAAISSSAAAGFAVYNGVMALAVASTGTKISTLSGAAAYKATMAAIGGGSLAAGGWGMAGGAAILGTVVAAPALALGGLLYSIHAEKELSNAIKDSRLRQEDAEKLKSARLRLLAIKDYANKLHRQIADIHQHFSNYHKELKNINDAINHAKESKLGLEIDLKKLRGNIIMSIQNGYALAAILTDIITTPLFKLKENGQSDPISQENSTVAFEKDENGLEILNKEGLDAVLAKAKNDFNALREDAKSNSIFKDIF